MYTVRLHFKNGTTLSYVWSDMGAAHKTKDLCARAMLAGNANPPRADGAICAFWDEAGREAHVDGADLSTVQFVDIAAEVTADFEANLLAEQTRQALLRKHGLVPPPPETNGFVSPYRDEPPRASSPGWPEDAQMPAHAPTRGINRFEG